MKLLPMATLVIVGAAVVGCGTTRENRYNETAYADHSAPRTYYEHEVVYQSPAYGDADVVYVHPAYRVVPVTRYYYYD